MAESCKVLGEIVLNILANLKGRQDVDIVVNAALQKLEEVAALGDSISVSLLGQKVRISVGISLALTRRWCFPAGKPGRDVRGRNGAHGQGDRGGRR